MATDEQRGEQLIITGSHGQYHWLTSTEQYIGTLIRLCADAILGRYLAVTSIDSGTPWLTDRQRANGWQLRSGIVYSPRITTVEELSYQRDGADSPGYDEWYVFDAPPAELGEITRESPFVETHAPRPGRLTVLVNYSAFVIHDIDSAVQFIVEIFWRQLEWVQPCAYVADGPSHLTFVCTNRQLFDSVFQRLNAALTK